MTNEEKILSYLRDRGLVLTRYVDTYRHVIPALCASADEACGVFRRPASTNIGSA